MSTATLPAAADEKRFPDGPGGPLVARVAGITPFLRLFQSVFFFFSLSLASSGRILWWFSGIGLLEFDSLIT